MRRQGAERKKAGQEEVISASTWGEGKTLKRSKLWPWVPAHSGESGGLRGAGGVACDAWHHTAGTESLAAQAEKLRVGFEVFIQFSSPRTTYQL